MVRRVPLDCMQYRRLIGVPTEPLLYACVGGPAAVWMFSRSWPRRSRAPVLRQNLTPAPKRSINRQMFGENKISRAGHDRRRR